VIFVHVKIRGPWCTRLDFYSRAKPQFVAFTLYLPSLYCRALIRLFQTSPPVDLLSNSHNRNRYKQPYASWYICEVATLKTRTPSLNSVVLRFRSIVEPAAGGRIKLRRLQFGDFSLHSRGRTHVLNLVASHCSALYGVRAVDSLIIYFMLIQVETRRIDN
jgi:hypothetical protein